VLIALAAARLAESRLPHLVAFLFAGAALGPSGLSLVTERDLSRLQFVAQAAFAVLLFQVGRRLAPARLRRRRRLAGWVMLQSGVASVAVYAAVTAAGAGLPLALILAALAAGGAPMTVASIARSLDAQTPLSRDTIFVHTLSDAVAAALFGVLYPLAVYLSADDHTVAGALLRFLRRGPIAIALGVLIGWLIVWAVRRASSRRSVLVLVLAMLGVTAAVCTASRLSLPLAALTAGAMVASTGAADARVFPVVHRIEAPVYLVFFALAGAALDVRLLPQIGAIGSHTQSRGRWPSWSQGWPAGAGWGFADTCACRRPPCRRRVRRSAWP